MVARRVVFTAVPCRPIDCLLAGFVLASLVAACGSTGTRVSARSSGEPLRASAPAASRSELDGPPVQAPTAQPPTDDQACQADGFDFAHKVFDRDGVREVLCGVGPGTSCAGAGNQNSCDGTRLMYCLDGRLAALDCLTQCRDAGDMTGQTYDSGTCGLRDNIVQCICCDAGEPGCENIKPRPRSRERPYSGKRLSEVPKQNTR